LERDLADLSFSYRSAMNCYFASQVVRSYGCRDGAYDQGYSNIGRALAETSGIFMNVFLQTSNNRGNYE
jgi:hypothetical protein